MSTQWTITPGRYLYLKLVDALSGIFLMALVGVGVGLALLDHYSRDLPDYQQLAEYEPPIVSRVYAADGQLIGEFAAEKRVFVPFEAVPKRVLNAFIAAEDHRFFWHPGFDIHGIVRALRNNLATSGRRVQGGSTITQQVAKNMLLTPERSIGRKIRELILAVRIERTFSKEKIAEIYLNEIYLGRQAYGIAAAAQVYFDKSLDELTVAEAALLAALPQAPSRFNPARSPRAATARRNHVIERMLENGYISAAEAEHAAAEPLGVKAPPRYLSHDAEYFVEEVRRGLIAKHGEKKAKTAGYVVRSTIDLRLQAIADEALRRGLIAYDRRHGWRGPVATLSAGNDDWRSGWRQKLRAVKAPDGHGDWPLAVVIHVEKAGADVAMIDGRRGYIPLSELTWARKQGEVRTEPGKPSFRTAVGPAIRRASDVLKPGDVVLVEELVAEPGKKPPPPNTYGLRQVPEVTGALVAMDPHAGRVRAMSGGYSFWLSQFNNATQAWRQPGSSFKPYVYLAALQEGFTPTTVVLDAPIAFRVGDKIYEPKNYSGEFYGPTTMRTALEQSRNVVAVRMAQATGLKAVAKLATSLGVSDKLDPVLSLALGAFETTPMRQAAAYAMIANGGRRIVPTLVDRVQDRYGRTIYRHEGESCDACAQAAYRGQFMPDITSDRERVLDEANAYQMITMLEGAIQRGTGVALRGLGRPIAGKTGTTNDYMDAWFVGFTPDLVVSVWVGFDKPRSLGKMDTGGVTAAPIARDFFRAALDGVPKRDFVRPSSIVVAQGEYGPEYYKRGVEPGNGARELDGFIAEGPEQRLEQIGRGAYITY